MQQFQPLRRQQQAQKNYKPILWAGGVLAVILVSPILCLLGQTGLFQGISALTSLGVLIVSLFAFLGLLSKNVYILNLKVVGWLDSKIHRRGMITMVVVVGIILLLGGFTQLLVMGILSTITGIAFWKHVQAQAEMADLALAIREQFAELSQKNREMSDLQTELNIASRTNNAFLLELRAIFQQSPDLINDASLRQWLSQIPAAASATTLGTAVSQPVPAPAAQVVCARCGVSRAEGLCCPDCGSLRIAIEED